MDTGRAERTNGITPLIVGIATLVAGTALAEPPPPHDTLGEALLNGQAAVDLRYRYEGVDQDGIDRDAEASTIRLRVGYLTGGFRGWSFFGELEGTEAIGSDRFNSTANGRTEFPVVGDPEDAEVNRAWVRYDGLSNTVFTLGRQRVKLDNDRFVGNVGWRQNEQTYDAFRVTHEFGGTTPLTVIHINNANRIFGEHHPDPALADLDLNAQVLHVSHPFEVGTLSGYVHLLEFEAAPAASHRNIGLRFVGRHPFSDAVKLLYTVEYGNQSDYRDAPESVDADYQFLELGAALKPLTFKLGYEVLGGDGVYGFQTPLATLHAHNGWTDKFLATPPEGLQDLYLRVSATCWKWNLVGVYHDFSADEGGADYGDELGFSATRSFKQHYGIGVKYATYGADSFSSDTDKFWVWLQFKL